MEENIWNENSEFGVFALSDERNNGDRPKKFSSVGKRKQ